MRNPKTLFVLGAGASKEVDLPTGRELIDIVAAKLDYRIENNVRRQGTGDDDILDIFQRRAQTHVGIMAYFEAAWRIRDGIIYSKSIDSFMDLHREDELIQLCGKLAIVKAILESEQKSKLYINPETHRFQDVAGLKGTWFVDFAKNLTDGVRKSEIDRIFDKVSFVIFNYDRCFEHFMFHALQGLYGLDDATAAHIMGKLEIIHPYGAIAELPWQHRSGIPFGFGVDPATMEAMTHRIRTYTEQIERSDTLERMKASVSSADTLVFLGFSYHPANMELLTLGTPGNTEQVFGTAKKISSNDIGVIHDQIRELICNKALRAQGPNGTGGQRLFIKDIACSELLQEYSRSLFETGSLNR